MSEVRVLQFSWGVSRGRETFGYNICRVVDTSTGQRFRCSGGGYDMEGTVFAAWLQHAYQPRLQKIAARAHQSWGVGLPRETNKAKDALYGMSVDKRDGYVSLDGACGLESMKPIAEAIGLKLTSQYKKRGGLTVIVVLDPES